MTAPLAPRGLRGDLRDLVVENSSDEKMDQYQKLREKELNKPVDKKLDHNDYYD